MGTLRVRSDCPGRRPHLGATPGGGAVTDSSPIGSIRAETDRRVAEAVAAEQNRIVKLIRNELSERLGQVWVEELVKKIRKGSP
jgi:hypothetical protein